MYNPFKPHMVKFSDGTYGIRKFDSAGWVFLRLNREYRSWSYWADGSFRSSRTRCEHILKNMPPKDPNEDKGVRVEV